MGAAAPPPSLYGDLAGWWPVLSSPGDYAEEAAFYRRTLLSAGAPSPGSLLELGSGGGNNASHLKRHFSMTLVDLSPGMLAVSRALNPECEHVLGDMRTARLGRLFDAVFIQDAIAYMRTEEDLAAAIGTAFEHCRPGGVALFAPDHTRETFAASTDRGGHDCAGRSMRYLEWTWDPDPADSTYVCDMAYMLREADGSVRCMHDRHVLGLFGHDVWLRLLGRAGFEARSLPFEHSGYEPDSLHVFVGRRPRG